MAPPRVGCPSPTGALHRINVRVARAGLRIAEVPSVEHERLFGESKLHAVRDGLRVLRTIITERSPRAAGQPGSAGVGVEHIEPAEV